MNEVPLIVLAVANVVAVDALPVNAPVNPVEDTDDKPANVVEEPPNAIAVVPTVTVFVVIEEPTICDEPLTIPAGIELILA